jgi:hypothetical protein
VVLAACRWRGADPLMACLGGHRFHRAPLNRVVVVSFLSVVVAKSFGRGDRRRLDPAPYSVSVQFRQSRFCVTSRSKQTEEENNPRIVVKGTVHDDDYDHQHSVTLELVILAA